MKYRVHRLDPKGQGPGCGLCHVKLEHISVRQGRQQILEDINLSIHCGELTALVGRNGAGKTTLIRALLGEIKHTGGPAYTQEDGRAAQRPIIGYIPQHLEFDRSAPVSVLDFLAAAQGGRPVWLPPRRGQRKQVAAALAEVDCAALLDRRLGELSGGELQRVMLAVALDPMPDVLVLDEPVSGVDQKGLEMFYERVSQLRRGRHMAILLVSHDLKVVRRYADRVVVLERRILADGTPGEVLSDPNVQAIFTQRSEEGAQA